MTSVLVAADTESCFRYLADPRNRPQWQSSLRAVEVPAGEVRVGMRWRDVTVVGIKPVLEITRMEPFRLWEERGWWRGVEADLALRFVAVPGGTRVSAEVRVSGRGLGRVAASAARRLAPRAIEADLRTAARLIERR